MDERWDRIVKEVQVDVWTTNKVDAVRVIHLPSGLTATAHYGADGTTRHQLMEAAQRQLLTLMEEVEII